MAGITSSSAGATPAVRAYPAWLEAWWLAQAARLRGADADAPESFLPSFEGAVRRLSDLFTVERPGGGDGARIRFPDYHANPELALAYGLFFFPQNFARARLPLAEAVEFRGWRPVVVERRSLRVLDLGAGAGAAGLGVALLLRERGLADEVELTAVDHSADALARLSALARDCAAHMPGISVRAQTRDASDWVRSELPRAREAFDLIVLGFSLNEFLPAARGLDARADFTRALRRALAENGLLLIVEPALRETAEPLQELSDALCAKNPALDHLPFPRWGPYLGDFPCPLRAEGKFWNHEVRAWTPPASLEFLNRKLWREIGELKFSHALHGRSAPPPLAGVFAETGTQALTARLVSPLHLRKGGFVAAAVTTDGRKITIELPTRGLAKSEIKRLEKIGRGDVLALRDLRPIGATPETFRIPNPEAIAGRCSVE